MPAMPRAPPGDERTATDPGSLRMRRLGTDILFSASDLTTFLACPHAATLQRMVFEGALPRPAHEDPMLAIRRQRGLEHESRYLQDLRHRGLTVLEIDQTLALENRIAQTSAAMGQGVQVIFQAALRNGAWAGFADFLVRVDPPAGGGGHAYEIVDTKLATRAKASHGIQLALYADMVEAMHGRMPPRLRVKLGPSRGAAAAPDEAEIEPAEVIAYTRAAMLRFEAFAAGFDLGAAPATRPEPCAHCADCDFKSRCAAEWDEAGHLRLVANIRGSQIEKLRAQGIDRIEALAAHAGTVAGLKPEILDRLREQARLQLTTRAQAPGWPPAHRVLPVMAGRGFHRLPEPARGDVFFDMEGDPLHAEGGLEYLFGAWVAEGDGTFRTFWGHDRAEEKRALEEFIDWLTRHLAEHRGAHVYHYNHYEPNALRRLASLHGTREDDVDALLRRQVFVDLLVVVREQLRIGEPGYSLKNVEKLYRAGRTGAVGSAGDSIVAYERWCETGDDAILRQIEAYNRDDCESTQALRDWLIGQRPAGLPWFVPGQDADDANDARGQEAAQRQLQAQQEQQARERILVDGAPDDEIAYRQLVFQLTLFHRREQKPEWWDYFDRMTRDSDDLVADAASLGGLSAHGPSVPDMRSLRRSYEFPPQETKLRAGDKPTIAATGAGAGVIVAMDMAARSLTLRRGARQGPLPDTLDLGPEKPRDDKVLRQAVIRFAASVGGGGGGAFPAVESILRRDQPRLRAREPGAPILKPGATTLADIVAAVSALDDSHLVIQGPPGTGKTWTASRCIVALLRDGKRVAVAAHSHKAINNLLAGIEAAAREANVSFSGIKRATRGEADQEFAGANIRTVFENDDVDARTPLVAGTAWLFARDEHSGAFDHLFVDEAGQVSLANLVAMGVAARNIVLVGDQQQLGQPIKGAHPKGTGVSVLEHLLAGRATVGPERGILLDVTYRMHPHLADWVSRTMYDGRLRAAPATHTQRLVLPAGAPAPLAPTGLHFREILHAGRSQSCPEEAGAVAELWAALAGGEWIDQTGTRRRIGPENILVVAPYNAQVNLLASRLPAQARVGTVDKFQGQEAAAVLISMTSSSTDDAPRDASFLLSRNRLNVAVSRARCLAVVLASPSLLATRCTHLADLRLANTLCSARGWAQQIRSGTTGPAGNEAPDL